MADLNDVVKGALDAATAEPVDVGGDDGADATVETDSTPESASADEGAGAADAAVASTEGAAAEAAAASTETKAPDQPVDSDLAREMEALGLKHVAGKDNRIPYSRVMKIVENARKRASEEHAKLQEQAKKDYEAAQQELQNFRAVDQLIQSDPERYLTLLSGYVPAYQKFLQQQAAQAAPAPAPGEQMPQPDTKFPDGSPGYSPEQHQKLVDWQIRQAEERAVKRVEQQYQQRLAPIEQRIQAEQRQQQQAWQLQQEVAEVHDTWGRELVESNKDAILDYMNKNPKVPLRVAAGHVLRPKLHADRTRVREEILKEFEARPKAAAPTPSAPSKTVTPAGPRSLEDIIKDSLAAVRG